MNCKLHVGCGTVYLEEYINIHPAPDSFDTRLAAKTTIDKYYAAAEFDHRPTLHVADVKSTVENLPNLYEKESIDEICMFHVLEHIPKYDLDKSLGIISSLLKSDGYFRVAVPDFDGIVLEYAEKLKQNIPEEEKEWYYRFVHGTQKDKYSHHYCGYNKYRLTELLKGYGFVYFKDLENQNFYPSVHLLAQKGNA